MSVACQAHPWFVAWWCFFKIFTSRFISASPHCPGVEPVICTGCVCLVQASQSANKLTSNTTEDVGDEEYVPCNSIHQLVDLGTEEYSPSRPGLVDASGSAYVPSSSRPSLRVAPSVPTHLDKRNKETKVEPEKLKVPHADRQVCFFTLMPVYVLQVVFRSVSTR